MARRGKGKVRAEFSWGNLTERSHLENRRRWGDNIKIDLKWGEGHELDVSNDRSGFIFMFK